MGERQEVIARRKNGDEFPTEASISKLDVGGERVYTFVLRDITERKHAEERQRMLIGELDHRVKNTLATVRSVISQTRQGSKSLADFVETLNGRICSMAATHELLSFSRWKGVSLAELVRRELAPYATSDNTEINGLDIVLRPEAGQAMAMVLHELTDEINPVIRGWVNYFAVGHSSECFNFVQNWVEKKVRRHVMHARQRKGFSVVE
jgi:HWE histidine kinase/Group II intron, maturase-specific domain